MPSGAPFRIYFIGMICKVVFRPFWRTRNGGDKARLLVIHVICKNLDEIGRFSGKMIGITAPAMLIVSHNSDSQCAVRSSISYLFCRYDL